MLTKRYNLLKLSNIAKYSNSINLKRYRYTICSKQKLSSGKKLSKFQYYNLIYLMTSKH